MNENIKNNEEMRKYINMKEDQEMFDKCIENMKQTKNRINHNMYSNQSQGNKNKGFKLFNSRQQIQN